MSNYTDINVNTTLQDLTNQWAKARNNNDISKAKKIIEMLIRFISAQTVLLKLAVDTEETEAVHCAVEQLKEAKEELRKLNQQTVFAY